MLQAVAATGFSGYLAREFVPRGKAVQALRAAFSLTEQAVG
ncbi:hypothetical protein [Deinococcus rubellus]